MSHSGTASRVSNLEVKQRKLDWLIRERKQYLDEEARTPFAKYYSALLEREVKIAKHNDNKLVLKWRPIMRDAKREEKQKDFRDFLERLRLNLQKRTRIEENLDEEMCMNEERFQIAKSLHIEIVDRLANLHCKCLDAFFDGVNAEAAMIAEEFEKERETMLELHQRDLDDFYRVSKALELRCMEEIEEDHYVIYIGMQDTQERNFKNKAQLRLATEEKVQELWNLFRKDLLFYNQKTQFRTEVFEALRLNDLKQAAILKNNLRRMKVLQVRIHRLRTELRKANPLRFVNASVLEQNAKLKKELTAQREKMRLVQVGNEKQLVKLAMQTKTVLEELKRQAKLGKKVITMAHVCRKMELEEEKVTPFFVSSLNPNEDRMARSKMQMEPQEELTKVLWDYVDLENFWKRYNKVLMEKTLMEQQRDSLLKDRDQLLHELAVWCSNVNYNPLVITRIEADDDELK